MDQKNYLVILLGILAVILAWYFFTQTKTYVPEFGQPLGVDEFKNSLVSAKQIFVVMDVRNSDSTIQTNILQCGVDFASSTYLGSKEPSFLSIDSENNCIDTNNTKHTTSYCFPKDIPIIYIFSGNSTIYYKSALAVGINSNYTAGGCGIRFK